MTRLRDRAQSGGPAADQEARARNLIGNHLADATDLDIYPIQQPEFADPQSQRKAASSTCSLHHSLYPTLHGPVTKRKLVSNRGVRQPSAHEFENPVVKLIESMGRTVGIPRCGLI
ncbi:hypothetical protein ABZY19_37560 [Streptomyces sp. NPDC006475]|uniref:hypothetical protein n=1 Tax=Streptomyces sp. NPDC006475 TaxID=3155719 RepID=UPI0033BF6A24